ncbi:hypothetical protein [Burkholderia sp. 22PA0106]|uniref:hypothetical protein n=1 Tax=Burkholderia sp. 22PA0106 TaxID=3237371 RepID=UPI0039C04593
MAQHRFSIPRAALTALHHDVSEWIATRGMFLRDMPEFMISGASDASLPILYTAQLEEAFFLAYPHWGQYIVQ